MNSQAEFLPNTSAPYIVTSVFRWQMKELGHTRRTVSRDSMDLYLC